MMFKSNNNNTELLSKVKLQYILSYFFIETELSVWYRNVYYYLKNLVI